MNASAPGWNPDPTGRHEYRYWDGSTWTDDVSDNGVTSVDPVSAPVATGPGAPTAPFEPTQPYGGQPGEYGASPSGGFGSSQSPGGFGSGPAPGGFGTPPGGAYGPQGGPSGQYPPGFGSGGYPAAKPPRSGPPPGVIAGLVAAAVVVLGVVGYVVFAGDDDPETTTDTTAPSSQTTAAPGSDTTAAPATDTTAGSETTDVFSIGVGDCLTDETSTEGEISDVQTIPCDQAHTFEVYHSYIIDAADFPDSTEMDSISEEQCTSAFATFIGLPYDQSIYYFQSLTPTAESWASGDREILCMVYDQNGTTTGSLAGIGQ
jgi:Septum formation/Protein of unknown function (DUF2510)